MGGYYQCGTSADCPTDNPGYEIDFFETRKDVNDLVYINTIQNNPQNQCNRCVTTHNWDPSTDFHTYTLAWTPNSVSFFIDGKEIRTNLTGIPPFKMDLYLNTFTWRYEGIEDFIIDYVKIYKPCDYPAPQANGYVWSGPTASSSQIWPSYYKNDLGFKDKYATNSPSNLDITASTIQQSVSNGPSIWYVKNGLLYYANTNNSGTTTYSSFLATNVSPSSNLSFDYNVGGKVFYKGTDNCLWTVWWNHTAYVPDRISFNPNVSSDVLFVKENSFHYDRVYYRDNTNRLRYIEWCPSASTWYLHSTNVTNVAGSLNADKGTLTPGKIYYKGIDNHLWHVWIFTSPGTTCNTANASLTYAPVESSYQSPNADCAGEIQLSERGTRVYYRNFDNELVYYEYNSGSSVWDKKITDLKNVKSKLRIYNDNEFYYLSTNDRVYHYFKIPYGDGDINSLCSGSTRYSSQSKSHLRVFSNVPNFPNFTDNPVRNTLLEVSNTSPKRIFYIDNGGTSSILKYFEENTISDVENPAMNVICSYSFPPPGYANDLVLRQNPLTINMETDINGIKIFPNPSQGIFKIILNDEFKNGEIRIFDTNGKQIYVNKIHPWPLMNINLYKPVRGIYLFEIKNEKRKTTGKILIN